MSLSFTYNIASRKRFLIQGKIEVEKPSAELWKILKTPGHLKNFHPFCMRHDKAKSWTKIGDTDQAQFYSGKQMEREIIDWQEGKEFTIKMKNEKQNNTQVNFSLQPEGDRSTLFTIQIDTDAYRKVPRPLWFLISRYFLLPSYKKYLRSILKGFVYYSTTHKQVIKNQFGRHQRFSP